MCGDPDTGGDNGTVSNVKRITSLGLKVFVAPKLPEGLDPDEFVIRYGMEGWKQHIDSAIHGYTYIAQGILAESDTSFDRGKAALLESAVACSNAFFNLDTNIGSKLALEAFFWPTICEALGMSLDDLRRQLEETYQQDANAQAEAKAGGSESPNTPNTFDPASEFVQKVRRELYGDKPWICVNGMLHFWAGTYYKPSLDVVENQRLWRYCNSYPVEDSDGNVKYPYASPNAVKKALEWVKLAYGIDPTLVNPPGLNCTNGVLQLTWNGDKPSWELKDHDPELYYIYEPITTYNPDADSTDCDRALEVLDQPQREIFLRTVAASLDLATVRQYKGRLVRALLLKGHGSNGKDTLREIVASMYGYQAMTGATLTDFASYDQGRKFPLARLNRSRVNWSSENASTTKLDKIQSLKAFITGDPLSIEVKGRDEYEFTPVGVGLFNINDVPNLQASLEAIQSRWGVLSFNKTFKIGADIAKGELEADPRFKYDPDFLRSKVLPAFLNRVLVALIDLMASGIDYSCTQQALENIQAENSHLFQFCLDVGLGYDSRGTVSAGEIWERLENWYVDNGTLTYEEDSRGKKKKLWSDQARRDDANVKGPNQVLAKFKNLFPKAKQTTVGKGKMALQGISFRQQQPEGEAVDQEGEAVVSQLVRQKPLPSKDGEPVTPISQLAEKFENESPDLEQNRSGENEKDSGENKNHNRCQDLPQLAHHPDTVRNTGSPTAPLTGSPLPQTGSPLPQTQTATVTPKIPQLPQPEVAIQPELDLNTAEKNCSIPEEFVQVLHNGKWMKALLLQEPNNHPDPSLRISGWVVRILATGLETHVWGDNYIRRCT